MEGREPVMHTAAERPSGRSTNPRRRLLESDPMLPPGVAVVAAPATAEDVHFEEVQDVLEVQVVEIEVDPDDNQGEWVEAVAVDAPGADEPLNARGDVGIDTSGEPQSAPSRRSRRPPQPQQPSPEQSPQPSPRPAGRGRRPPERFAPPTGGGTASGEPASRRRRPLITTRPPVNEALPGNRGGGGDSPRYEAEPRGNPFALGIGPNPLLGLLYKAQTFRNNAEGQLTGGQSALGVKLSEGVLVRSRQVGSRGQRRPRDEPLFCLTGRPRFSGDEFRRSRRPRAGPTAPEDPQSRFDRLYAEHPEQATTISGVPMPRYQQLIWAKWNESVVEYYPAYVLGLAWQEEEFNFEIHWATDTLENGLGIFPLTECPGGEDRRLGTGMQDSELPWDYADPNPQFWGEKRAELYRLLGYGYTGQMNALSAAAQRATSAVSATAVSRAKNNAEAGPSVVEI